MVAGQDRQKGQFVKMVTIIVVIIKNSTLLIHVVIHENSFNVYLIAGFV